MTTIPNLKYKTTLCLSWLEGVECVRSHDCYFAHGEHELRTLEQNRHAIAERNRNANLALPSHNYKTVFCKFYGKGECRLGEACTFAHERREKIKRATPSQLQNEDVIQQYYAYYQMSAWMAHYASYPAPQLTENAFLQCAEDGENRMDEETLTADSPSPAISKSSNESEPFEKEFLEGRVEQPHEDQP